MIQKTLYWKNHISWILIIVKKTCYIYYIITYKMKNYYLRGLRPLCVKGWFKSCEPVVLIELCIEFCTGKLL